MGFFRIEEQFAVEEVYMDFQKVLGKMPNNRYAINIISYGLNECKH